MAPRIVSCPSCRAHLDVSQFQPGARLRCGSCDRELTVPAAAAFQDAPPVPSPRPAAPQPLRSRRGGARGRRGGVPNLLPWAIVATLLCCQIGGIIAIVYAVQANSHAAAGNTRRAEEAVKTAKAWLWVSAFTPFVVFGLIALTGLASWQR